MELLLNPNIAYLVLVAGTFFILMAIIMPGTGIPEVLGIFSLVFAGYAVYHLSLNWWALVVLLLSLVPFFFAIRGPRRGIWLPVAIVGMTVGSVFFFPAQDGLISVNPLLAAGTTVLFGASAWIAARKVVQAAQARPMHELSSLIGQKGEAKTAVKDEGSVQVAGELWSARSTQSVPAGSTVRVIGRQGFVLLVESDTKR